MRVFHKSLNVAGETRSDARVASEGPRATVTGGFLVEKRPLPRRAWALACHTRIRAGSPRHAAVYRTFAGDRPPRYGNRRVSCRKTVPLPRRARACPSPCCGLPDVRGGQAPALRYCDIFFPGLSSGVASRPGGLSYRGNGIVRGVTKPF